MDTDNSMEEEGRLMARLVASVVRVYEQVIVAESITKEPLHPIEESIAINGNSARQTEQEP